MEWGSSLSLPYRDANYRVQTAFDIVFGRRPRRDADTHRRAPLPHRPATPAGSVGLNRLDYAPGRLIIAERDQRLVERDVVQYFVSGGAQSFGEARRMAAASLNQIGHPRSSQRAKRRPDFDAARAP